MRRALLVPLACLALAACDDGPSIDPEADEERIEGALLQLDDLPDGFEEREAEDDDEDNECVEELGIEQDELDEAEVAQANTRFSSGEETDVRAEITSVRDTDLAERVLDGVGDEAFLECLGDALGDELPDGAEVLDLDEGDAAVEGGRALRATIEFGDGQQRATVVSEEHAVLVDRFLVSLTVTQLGGAPDEGLVEDALEAMVERLEADDD